MNKTMVTAMNKSSGPHKSDYLISSVTAPAKRSGSGKAKKPDLLAGAVTELIK